MAISKHWNDESSWFVDMISSKRKLQFQSFTSRSDQSGLCFEYEGYTNVTGQPHGQGKMTFENGDVYDGHWLKGKLHGHASAKLSADGNRKQYEGEFQNGKQHGLGKFIWSDGEFYDGQWEFGLFHGHGIYGTPDGVELSCDFACGLPAMGSKCQVLQ